MSLKRACFHAGVLAFASAFVLSADIYTFNINQTVDPSQNAGHIGTTANITGTISTDVQFGPIGGSDITGFNLLMTTASASYNLNSAKDGVFVGGNDLNVDANGIHFNFGAADGGFLLFQNSFGSGLTYYCLANTTGLCYQGETINAGSIFNNNDFGLNDEAGAGNPTLNNAAPEPSLYVVVSLCLACLVVAAARRRKSADPELQS
jgi:hypothetical protein